MLHGEVVRCSRTSTSRLYAWGLHWGPEPGEPDDVFGFEPGNGIHNVHMNQGSADRHASENGVWRDGGLAIHHVDEERWVGIFLAFRSQARATDDQGASLARGEPTIRRFVPPSS